MTTSIRLRIQPYLFYPFLLEMSSELQKKKEYHGDTPLNKLFGMIIYFTINAK